MEDNARAKIIDAYCAYLKDNSKADKIKCTGMVELYGNSRANNIEAKEVEIYGGTVGKIEAKGTVSLGEKAIIEGDIIIDKKEEEDKPILEITGPAKVLGNIIFPDKKGKILIYPNEKNLLPYIDKNKVKNGEIRLKELFKLKPLPSPSKTGACSSR